MTPVLVSVDKAGDLKLGARKCRLYKKDEVVKVAKKYGINTEKKTVRSYVVPSRREPRTPHEQCASREVVPRGREEAHCCEEACGKEGSRQEGCRQLYEGHDQSKIASPGIPNPPRPRSPNPAAVARARANVKNMIDKRVSYMNAAGSEDDQPSVSSCSDAYCSGTSSSSLRSL
jgi:hypothetical protein